MAEGLGDWVFVGRILGNMGVMHMERGRLEEAKQHYLRAIDIHVETGNRRSEGIVYGNMGELLSIQGELDAAIEYYNRALEIHREVGNPPFEAVVVGSLGESLLMQGNRTAAEEHFRLAISLADEVNIYESGAFRGSLALMRAQEGAFDEARALLEVGEPRLRDVHAVLHVQFLCKRGQVEVLASNYDAATAALQEAEAIAEPLGRNADSTTSRAISELRTALLNREDDAPSI